MGNRARNTGSLIAIVAIASTVLSQGPAASVPVAPSAPTAAAKTRPAPKGAIVTFAVGLKRNDAAASAQVAEVSDPRSKQYRVFPIRSTVRAEFGAKPASLKALRRSTERFTLNVSLDRTGVFAQVSGRAKDMSRWLGGTVTVQRMSGEGFAATLYRGPAKLPKELRGKVREFVPVDWQVAADPQVSATALPPYEGTNDGTPASCLNAEGNKYVYAYNQLRTAYGIDDLPATRRVARAVRLAIMAQGDGFSVEALRASAKCFGVASIPFRRRSVPGLSTPLPVGDEGQLDVQVVQSVLPAGSRVDVVESAPFDGRSYLAWARAYRLQKLPDVITTSYGNCEPQWKQLMGASKSLSEAVLARLALAGTSVFSAAGDQGSSDCVENNGTGEGNKELAVDYPGSSPYVTSVGGTRLIVDKANGRVGEWVWNSTVALPPVGPAKGGGGGGVSRWFERPWWQPKAMTKSAMRTVPDLAAHAATGPYWPLFMGEAEFEPVGGTSAATPMTAASVGIIAAAQRVNGQPALGAVQPMLYRLQQKHPAAFYDVVDGDNDVYDQGCCSAKVGYDKASGLGSPNFDVWLRRLPAAR